MTAFEFWNIKSTDQQRRRIILAALPLATEYKIQAYCIDAFVFLPPALKVAIYEHLKAN